MVFKVKTNLNSDSVCCFLNFVYCREFRIIHALSHHLYTNTIIDLEISALEPLIEYMPKKKSGVVKYLSWIYIFFVWVTFLHQIVVKK